MKNPHTAPGKTGVWGVRKPQKQTQKNKMNTYDIHFFKTSNLSPDEKNVMRRNAFGIWLVGGRIKAKSARAACAAYRKSGELGSNASKLRAQ
jgi:hypothetical protein